MCVERAPTPIRKKWKCRGSLWAGLHKDWFTDGPGAICSYSDNVIKLFFRKTGHLRNCHRKMGDFRRQKNAGISKKFANQSGFLPEMRGFQREQTTANEAEFRGFDDLRIPPYDEYERISDTSNRRADSSVDFHLNGFLSIQARICRVMPNSPLG